MEENLKIWNDAKRIVVKVGSSLVTNEGHGVDTEAIARWTAQIAKLQEMGKQVVWVSSGAVAEGMARLGWTKRPKKCTNSRPQPLSDKWVLWKPTKKLRALRHSYGSDLVDAC